MRQRAFASICVVALFSTTACGDSPGETTTTESEAGSDDATLPPQPGADSGGLLGEDARGGGDDDAALNGADAALDGPGAALDGADDATDEDAAPVVPLDGGADAGPRDAGIDAGPHDAGGDAGRDAGVDAGHDAGHDAGIDAGHDAGIDAGPPDAGIDSGPTEPPVGISVLQFHNHASRDGTFIDPLLTRVNAAKMHIDPTFHPPVVGGVYAQPLYVEDGPGGKGIFIAATEMNNVYAIDETGAQVWMQNVGTPASGAESCGNIKPLGITGTPVVDLARRAVYLDAARPGEAASTMAEHEIHALSIDTGKELAGWPVAASSVTAANNQLKFVPNPQNERGALLIVGNTLYVPYGGHSGDCADTGGVFYHGWVIGVPLDHPSAATGFATDSQEAGMWSVGGMASDGTNLFATTGNSGAGKTCPSTPPVSPPPGWQQQEAILRFQAGPVWSGQTTDYFAPIDWGCLDNADLDVGGSNPVLVDLPNAPAGSPSKLVVALGKDGNIYVADRTNLGGVGNDLASLRIINGQIKMAATAYSTSKGTYVVAYGSNNAAAVGCPSGQSGSLVAVKITPGTPPTLSVAWCAASGGEGSPIFTTTDGATDPIVWSLGNELTNQLHAWDPDTGAIVFGGGKPTDSVNYLHHFSTILVVKGRIFTAADNFMNAFGWQ